ncbi:hypothetical protein [Cribrihabitans neustonicus]|uniref:hypothetical protein n=1 Tax=Cribrihabitans neustonicus TaxID=1429085 RepID=UPI003B5BDB13
MFYTSPPAIHASGAPAAPPPPPMPERRRGRLPGAILPGPLLPVPLPLAAERATNAGYRGRPCQAQMPGQGESARRLH